MAVAVTLGAAPAVLSVGFSGSSSTIPLMNGGTNFAAGTTVVIGIGTRTGSPVTSATIGGTTLNLIGSQLGNGSDGLQLYYADLSSSTTDTLVVNYVNGAVFFLGAAAWILTGAATGGPFASAKNSLTNVPINATLALPSSGAIIALGTTWSTASYTPTWTNMSAGAGDFSIADGGGNLQVLGAHSTTAANPQFTGTGAGFISGIIAASWAAAASGSNFTLAGAEGAFTISGQSAALNKALKAAGAEGSFTISGKAAAMLRGIKLGGAEGAFVINGRAAAELRGIKLAGAEGSFTINGQPAVLSHGLHMPGSEGAFTISGQSAKFPVALSMKGVEGAFTISGQGAVLTYTPAGGGGAAVSHSNPFFSTPGPGMALP